MPAKRLLHVPYKGVPLATADLYSGREIQKWAKIVKDSGARAN